MSHKTMFSWIHQESWYLRQEAFPSLVIIIGLALVFAGCGGSTIPTTYSCNTTCHGSVNWHNPVADFGGKTLQGAKSAMKMINLTCAANCQAEGGYVANYITLADPTFTSWVLLGFRADVVATTHFFLATDTAGTVVFNNLGIVPPADIGAFDIYSINHYASGGGGYELRVSGPATFGHWTNGMTFSPGYWEFGQILQGTHGAGASGVGYICVNRFTDVLNAGPIGAPVTPGDFLDTVTSNGNVFHNAPPWARWIDSPLGPPTYPGGDFGTND